MGINILPSGRFAPAFLASLPGGVEGHVNPLVDQVRDELLVGPLLGTLRVVVHAERMHVARPACAPVALEVVPVGGALGERDLEVVHREHPTQLGPETEEALLRHSRT
jgi:hypothetical protein